MKNLDDERELREADWRRPAAYKAAVLDCLAKRGWSREDWSLSIDRQLAERESIAELVGARLSVRVGKVLGLDHRCRFELFDGTVAEFHEFEGLPEWLRREREALAAHAQRALLQRALSGGCELEIGFAAPASPRL